LTGLTCSDYLNDTFLSIGDGVSSSWGIPSFPPLINIGSDPFLVEHVLKTSFYKYEKGEFFRTLMQVFLGNGIFNSDGQTWQKQRKGQSNLNTFSLRLHQHQPR
jgi:hypothetical protein